MRKAFNRREQSPVVCGADARRPQSRTSGGGILSLRDTGGGTGPLSTSAFIDTCGKLMSVNVSAIDLEPQRTLGQGCCAHVDVELSTADVRHLSDVAKALSDPVRVQIVDVLRRQAGEVCVCDLQQLFDIAQPTLSHHLKKLREAGLVGVERRRQWAYYYVVPGALDPFSAWLAR
jgi:ArsR family transcriptional regulator